jgi:hypothetical protein
MISIAPVRDAYHAMRTQYSNLVVRDPSLLEHAASIPYVMKTTLNDELALVPSDLNGMTVRNGFPPENLGRYTSFNFLALLGCILAGKNVRRAGAAASFAACHRTQLVTARMHASHAQAYRQSV